MVNRTVEIETINELMGGGMCFNKDLHAAFTYKNAFESSVQVGFKLYRGNFPTST